MHVNSSDVFFQPVQFRRSRNGDNPLLFREQPSQSHLSWRRLFLSGEFADQIDQHLICVTILLREAGDYISEIVPVELRVLTDCSGQEPLTEWTERDEPDAKFLESMENLLLWFSPPKLVLALQRRYG